MKVFFVASSISTMQHEDVAMRLFVECLAGPVAEWFYSLLDGSIKNWIMLRNKFEIRFKMTKDDLVLVAQLGSMKKDVHETMRDLVAKFNKLYNKFSANIRHGARLLKAMFINTLPPDISFNIKRERAADIDVAQNLAVAIEDDLIVTGKWKKEL